MPGRFPQAADEHQSYISILIQRIDHYFQCLHRATGGQRRCLGHASGNGFGVYFSGNNSVTIPISGSVTTDNLPYAFNKANTYIISVGYSSASVMYGGTNNYGATSGLSGDYANAGTLDPSGYSNLGYTWHGLSTMTLLGNTISQTNTWAVPMSTQASWVMFNGSNGNYQSSVAGLAHNMDWTWANGYLYTYRADNANPSTVYSNITAAQAQDCIEDVNSVNYITVNGIGCTLANSRGISSSGNNWTIENCAITYTGNGLPGYGHGILAQGNNTLVTGCTLNYVNDFGIAFSGSNDLASIIGYLIAGTG